MDKWGHGSRAHQCAFCPEKPEVDRRIFTFQGPTVWRVHHRARINKVVRTASSAGPGGAQERQGKPPEKRSVKEGAQEPGSGDREWFPSSTGQKKGKKMQRVFCKHQAEQPDLAGHGDNRPTLQGQASGSTTCKGVQGQLEKGEVCSPEAQCWVFLFLLCPEILLHVNRDEFPVKLMTLKRQGPHLPARDPNKVFTKPYTNPFSNGQKSAVLTVDLTLCLST